METKKVGTIYINEEIDNKLKEMADMFSSDDEKITVSDIITAILCFQLGNLSDIDKPILRTYYTLLS